MQLALDEEQLLLADAVRRCVTRAYPLGTRARLVSSERGWSSDTWAELADMGILGLAFSEDDGGMGGSALDVNAVMTELGSVAAVEPVLDGVLLPGVLIAEAGSVDQRRAILPRVASGDLVLAFARPDGDDVQAHASATGDYTLTGTVRGVRPGRAVDTLVVAASGAGSAEGTRLFLVDADSPGVTFNTARAVDDTYCAEVIFTCARAGILGDDVDARPVIAQARRSAQIAICAEAVGAMSALLRLTVDYLKNRKQFGVPLSTFQTLKHRAADMFVELEMARGMSLYASSCLSTDDADDLVVSQAKYQIGRSARYISQQAIQLHGAIAMTDEYPAGQYVRRLLTIEHSLGSTDHHLRNLASSLAGHRFPISPEKADNAPGSGHSPTAKEHRA